MLTVCGSHAGVEPQLQLGSLGGHAQSVTAHGSVQAWHTMSEAHCESAVQCAGTHPYSIVVVHGTGAGHASPAGHGADGAQPEAPTCAHSKP